MVFISFFRGSSVVILICDALRILVPLVQFTKREKYPWRNTSFNKAAG